MIVEKAIISRFSELKKQVYQDHIPQGIEHRPKLLIKNISDINTPSKDQRHGYNKARYSLHHISTSKLTQSEITSLITTVRSIESNTIPRVNYLSKETLFLDDTREWMTVLDFEISYYS